jgi:hypothetical protein
MNKRQILQFFPSEMWLLLSAWSVCHENKILRCDNSSSIVKRKLLLPKLICQFLHFWKNGKWRRFTIWMQFNCFLSLCFCEWLTFLSPSLNGSTTQMNNLKWSTLSLELLSCRWRHWLNDMESNFISINKKASKPLILKQLAFFVLSFAGGFCFFFFKSLSSVQILQSNCNDSHMTRSFDKEALSRWNLVKCWSWFWSKPLLSYVLRISNVVLLR